MKQSAKPLGPPPIYDKFIDNTYNIGDVVELIHPSKFLSNAGKTSKDWNKKMLNDPHLSILFHEPDITKIFPSMSFKGGVCISYYDKRKTLGPIGEYSILPELISIKNKVDKKSNGENLSLIIYVQNKFNLHVLYDKYPSYKDLIGSAGRERRLTTNIFGKLDVFSENCSSTDDIKILGLIDNVRVYRYIQRDFIDENHENLKKWKVLIPKSNGSGALGEELSTPLVGEPLVGEPLVGYTQSFLGIGAFESEGEAIACLKYVKSKFARCMLGILKVTQDNPPATWKYVPLQDFTEASDIDWSGSVAEVDRQLYAKYGLDGEEIDFIESHVTAME